MEALLLLYSNRDKKDFQFVLTHLLPIFRFLLGSLTFTYSRLWAFICDVNGTYTQSRSIRRKFYVCPQKSISGLENIICKLLRLLYKIVEEGKQWLFSIKFWLVQELKLERTLALKQLSRHIEDNGRITLPDGKIVNNFLLVRINSAVDIILISINQLLRWTNKKGIHP